MIWFHQFDSTRSVWFCFRIKLGSFYQFPIIVVDLVIMSTYFCRQILLGSEILVLLGILLSFKLTSTYTMPQYVSSALITFVAAEVLEGIQLNL